MTLDDFLRALEGLIDDRESSDDQPGEGNFGCEECRACNHCRFCIGCDSCEDCTYCDECIDCTSATQSKRCVSCQKISYCDDCRECKGSRYLTLCVSCNDCVHCLACVGLEGSEFYVLNEKRTRKEYFALLRQVQELMAARMNGGWRPPNIGLASDIVDALVAGRDTELTAAPWLDDGGDAEPEPDEEEEEEPETRRATPIRDEWPAREGTGRERARGYSEESEARRVRGREDESAGFGRREASLSSPPLPEPREPVARDWIRDPPPEFGSIHGEREDERTRPRPRKPGPRSDYGGDLGRELGEDSWRDIGRPGPGPSREPARSRGDSSWGREPEREPERGREVDRGSDSGWGREPERGSDPGRGREVERGSDPGRGREPERGSDPGRGREVDRGSDSGWGREPERGSDPGRARELDRGSESIRGREHDDDPDVPHRHEQQPTQPFARQREREPYDPRGIPRVPEHVGRGRESSEFDDVASRPDESPAGRDREPSSPWLDEDQAAARRLAKRGSLRRAGRPTRPTETRRDSTGTGSAPPERTDGTHTGTGLRLGRKPKRR